MDNPSEIAYHDCPLCNDHIFDKEHTEKIQMGQQNVFHTAHSRCVDSLFSNEKHKEKHEALEKAHWNLINEMRSFREILFESRAAGLLKTGEYEQVTVALDNLEDVINEMGMGGKTK